MAYPSGFMVLSPDAALPLPENVTRTGDKFVSNGEGCLPAPLLPVICTHSPAQRKMTSQRFVHPACKVTFWFLAYHAQPLLKPARLRHIGQSVLILYGNRQACPSFTAWSCIFAATDFKANHILAVIAAVILRVIVRAATHSAPSFRR